MNSTGAAPRRTTIRVRYSDTDQMGVVYYANYLRWFEVGRTEWLRAGGWSYREMEATGLSLPVLEARCHYKQPARYDDEVAIDATPSLVSPARLRFDYEIRRAGDGALLAEGHTVHAAIDGTGRPRRLPVRVRELVA